MSNSTGCLTDYRLVATPALFASVLPRLPFVERPKIIIRMGVELYEYVVATTMVGRVQLEIAGIPVLEESSVRFLASRKESLVQYHQRHGRVVAADILACL